MIDVSVGELVTNKKGVVFTIIKVDKESQRHTFITIRNDDTEATLAYGMKAFQSKYITI